MHKHGTWSYFENVQAFKRIPVLNMRATSRHKHVCLFYFERCTRNSADLHVDSREVLTVQ